MSEHENDDEMGNRTGPDGTGEVQTDQRAEPIPDGASGWHSVVVMVR